MSPQPMYIHIAIALDFIEVERKVMQLFYLLRASKTLLLVLRHYQDVLKVYNNNVFKGD